MRRPVVVVVAIVVCAVFAVIVRAALTADTPPASTPASPAATLEQEPPPLSTATTSAPAPDPLTADPDTVAQQALTIMFSPYPGVDRSGADAFDRAAAWLSPRMRAVSGARLQSGPGAGWEDWRARQVTIVAQVQLGCSGCSPDSAVAAQRVATIVQFAVDPAGNTKAENALTAWVGLVRQQDGWRVDTLTF